MNYTSPAVEPVESYPAQTFEARVDTMVVSVSADEGAFPENTTMTVIPVYEEEKLAEISNGVEGEGTSVKRVHAVDITFRDVNGKEIEPLIPISVVMSIEELKQSNDAVVIHMDNDGNTEIVEQAESGETEVAFDAENFSIYAVVVTERYISADGSTWNIQVTYGADAGIPEGAVLSVREVGGEEYQDYLVQTVDAMSGRSINGAKFFDIDIVAGGMKIQPQAPVEVKITMEQGEGDVKAVHFGDEIEVIEEVRQDGESVSFEAESFSVYGVVFTVDFEYNGFTFNLPGGGRIWLTRLLKLINADFTVADVQQVRFSDPELVQIVPSIDEDNWLLISLMPFNTQEALTLTLGGGRQVVIAVTDEQTTGETEEDGTTDISGFLTHAEIIDNVTGNVIGSSEGQQASLHKSREYEIHLSFAEDEYGEQFPDTGVMIFELPEAVDLPGTEASHSGTFDIDLGRGHTLEGNTVVIHRAEKDAEGNVTKAAYIEVAWHETSSEYERLTYSPRAAFNLNYYFTINTDYDELSFSDTISVPITEDPEFHVTINKSLSKDESGNVIGYNKDTGIATYQLEVQAEGNAKDINVTDTLGKALDYMSVDSEVNVSVVYKNHNGGEPSKTYPDSNMTVHSEEDPSEQMVIHFNELADGDKAILTYQAKVDFTKLTTQEMVKSDTTNSAQATAGTMTTETTQVDLERYIQFLSILKKVGTIDTSHEDDSDPYWLVPYTVVYNHERKVPVVGTLIQDEIYIGDVHAASFYSDSDHPFEVKVYKDGFTYTESDEAEWTFNGNNRQIETLTYQFGNSASEPGVDGEGNPVAGTIQVTPSSVSDDLTDTYTKWAWTVPEVVDVENSIDASTPLTYEITYYTKVSLSMVNEGQVGNRVTESKSGDTSDAGHYVGHKEGTGLTVNKSVLNTDADYTQWQISFERAACNRAVVEDTLPKSQNGDYADTYFADSTHLTVVTGLTANESYEVNSTNAGRVIFTFYKDAAKTQPGLNGGGDPQIVITFYTKNDKDWMEKTALDGSAEQEHINRVRLIRDSKQAWQRATATPKEPKLIKTVAPAGTVYNRATGIYQPVYRYTLKLVGLDDTMFQSNELKITDEFDSYFTWVSSNTLAGDMSIGGDGTKTDDEQTVELADYGYTGSVSAGEEKLHQTIPEGKADTVHVKITPSTETAGGKKTITFTVDQYNKSGDGSHATDWRPWQIATTHDDGTTTYSAPRYGYAYELTYYLMITAEDMQRLAEEIYQKDETTVPEPENREGKVTLENKAHVTDNVEFLHSEDVPVTIDVRPINKTRTYDSNSELATYTLTINAQKIKLNNGEPYFVKDEFENLAVDYATISFVTDPVEARSQITHTYTGNTGTFMVPDQTKVVITYRAWPLGKMGDKVEMKNKATVMSYASVKNEEVTLKADHEGTAESYGVRVLKYSNDDMHKPLGWAVFLLLKMDENGNKVPVTYEKESNKTSPSEWDAYPTSYKASDYITGGSTVGTRYPTPQNHHAGAPVFFITSDRNPSIPADQEDENWGIAEIMLSQARDGVALSKGVRYYLREVETPAGHIKENTDWTFIIADNDDFDNYVYSNDSVLKISNPTEENDLVVEKDFYDHTGLVTKAGMYATTFEIVGRATSDPSSRVVFRKVMTYGNFKVVDEPQSDGSYVRKYKMIVGHGELPTGYYTVKETNWPTPENTTLTTTLEMTPEGVTLSDKAATFYWDSTQNHTEPLNIHFVNTYDDTASTKLDVKVKKVWSGEGEHPDIDTVSFDLYRTTVTDPDIKTMSAAALRTFVKDNNLLPVETQLTFTQDQTTNEYVWTMQKADKVSENGATYTYFALERAFSDQYEDSYAYATETAGEGQNADKQVITITNTKVTPTTSFTFGKLWAGPDEDKHLDTLVWPDNKTITVKIKRRENGRAGSVDGTFELTYKIDKAKVTGTNVTIEPEGAETEPVMTVLSSGNYSHYQFRIEGLEKFKTGTGAKWQYFATEEAMIGTGVEFDTVKYGYVDGIITAVTGWPDASSRDTGSNQVVIVESLINRAKPTASYDIPVAKVIDGNVYDPSDYSGKFTFELYQMVKENGSRTTTKRHIAYVKNVENAKFTVIPDFTEGLTYHAREKNAEGVYEDHPYFEGTYTYYIREVQPGEQNAELLNGQTEPTDSQKQQSIDGITFSRVVATVEYQVTLDWESGQLTTVRKLKYSNSGISSDEAVTFTNKYDEGERPLTLSKLWDDDGNRDGKRGDVKFQVTGTAVWTDDAGTQQTRTETWPRTEVGQEPQYFVIPVGNRDTFAKSETGFVVPVYIDSHPVTSYVVTEVECPEGYEKVTHTGTLAVVPADDINNNKLEPVAIAFTAENRHVTDKITSAVFTKTWDDDGNRDNKRPTLEAYLSNLHLYGEGMREINVPWSTATKTVNDDTVTYSDGNGEPILEATATGNTYVVNFYKGEFYLTDKNGVTAATATLIPLRKYKAPGDLILYYVLEDPVGDYTSTTAVAGGGYKSTVSSEDNYAIGMTNTVLVDRQAQVTLTKTWTDDENQDGKRPSRPASSESYLSYITLYANGKTVYTNGAWVTNSDDDFVKDIVDNVNKTNNPALTGNGAKNTDYTVTFTGLPLNENGLVGKPITYTLEEMQIGSGEALYTMTTGAAANDTLHGYTLADGADAHGKTIAMTNTHTSTEVKVKAKKSWVHHDHVLQSDELGDQGKVLATLKLVAKLPNGNKYTFPAGYDANKISNRDMTWASFNESTQQQEVTWENLPKYAPGLEGQLLTYSVDEVHGIDGKKIPDGYHLVLQPATQEGEYTTIIATNEYQETEIKATKKWIGDDHNRDNQRAPVTLQLWRKVGSNDWEQVPSSKVNVETQLTPAEVRPATSDEYATAVIPVYSAVDEQSVTWTGLPAWIGNEFVIYDAREVKIDHYTKQDAEADEPERKSGSDYQYETSEEITNTHTLEETTLSFTKQWNRHGYPTLPEDDAFKAALHLYASYNNGSETVVEEVPNASDSIAGTWKDNLAITKNGDTYSVTLPHLPKYRTGHVGKEIEYFVSEDNTAPANYTAVYPVRDAVATKPENKVGQGETLTNDHDTGSLAISKAVVSDLKADEGKVFTFTVTASPAITGSYPLAYTNGAVARADRATTIAFTNGTATGLTLTKGETVTISGLPTNVTYTVMETQESNFNTPTIVYADGVQELATKGQTVTANVTNTREVGNLTVSKTVKSTVQDDLAHAFTFKIELNELLTSPMTFGDVTFTDNVAYVTVTNGNSVTIEDLPTDIGYTVTEVSENAGGTISGESDVLAKFNTTQTGDTGSIDKDGKTAAFTNQRKPGTLTLTKALTNYIADDADDTFYFNVQLTGDDNKALVLDDTNAPIVVGGVHLTGTEAPGAGEDHPLYYSSNTIYNVPVNGHTAVTGKGTTTITGLPIGTTYVVTEADGWTNATYTALSTGNNIEKDNKAITGTIQADGTQSVAVDFTNTRKVGELEVSKMVDSPVIGDKTDQTYTIQVNLVTKAGQAPISATYTATRTVPQKDANGDLVDNGTSTTTNEDVTFTNGIATIALKHGETVKITGIPTDLSFTVTETAPANFTNAFKATGSDGTYATGNSGDILATDSGKTAGAEITNSRDKASLTVDKSVISAVQGDKAQEFSFRVTVVDGSIKNGTYGDMTFNNNVAEFTVSNNGPAVTVTDLPVGLQYKVEELNTSTGIEKFTYGVTGFGDALDAATLNTDGAVAGSASALGATGNTATFTNTRIPGELQITKTLANPIPSDDGDTFYFDVVLTGDDGALLKFDSQKPFKVGDVLVSKTSGEGDHPMYFDDATGTLKNVPVSWSYATRSGDVTISELPIGTTCTVTESGTWTNAGMADIHTANIQTVSGAQSVVGNIEQSTARTIDFANTRQLKDLTIGKTVDSPVKAEQTQAYEMTVTLNPIPAERSYVISGSGLAVEEGDNVARIGETDTYKVTFDETTGAAKIHVVGGQSVTIAGIPTDVTYTVTETAYGNIETSYTGQSARLLENGTYEAQVTNKHTLGGLAVTKNVVSSVQGDKTHAFKFRVTFDEALDDARNYGLTGGAAFDATDKRIISFTLTDEQTQVITGLPVGLGYKVEEINESAVAADENAVPPVAADPFTTDSFDTVVTGETGSTNVNKDAGVNTIPSSTHTISALEGSQTHANSATFTNTRMPYSLTLSKTLTDAILDDDGDIFYFDVTLKGEDGKALVIDTDKPIKVGNAEVPTRTDAPSGEDADKHLLYYMQSDVTTGVIRNVPVTWNTTKNGNDETIPDGAGGSVVISGLPVGTTYSVAETGWVLSKDGASTNIVQAESNTGNQTMRILSADASANFTNKRLTTASLTITKKVNSPIDAERKGDYKVVVTLVNRKSGKPVKNISVTLTRSGVIDATHSTDQTLEFASGSEEIKIRKDETVTLTGIPTDVTYTVTETDADLFDKNFQVKTDEDFVDSANPSVNTSGEITGPATIETQVTNSRKLGNLIIGKTVSSPVTADHGNDKYYWFKIEVRGYSIDNGLYTDNGVIEHSDGLTYTLSDNGVFFNNNTAYVKLKDTEFATAYKLPVGLTYKVTEITAADEFEAMKAATGVTETFDQTYADKFTPSWEKTVSGAEGSVMSGETNGKVFSDSTTAAVKYDTITEAASTVQFTNTRKTGDLMLTKTVVSPFQTEKDAYYFLKVKLETEEGAADVGEKVAVAGTYTVRYHSVQDETDTTTDRTAAFNTDGEAVIPVQGGGDQSYVEIIGLPIDVTYTVTEVTDTSHNVTKSDSETAFSPTNGYNESVFTKADDDQTGSIAKTSKKTATVTNTRKVQPISLKKVSTETSIGTGLAINIPGLTGAVFTLNGATVSGQDVWSADDSWSVMLTSNGDGVFKVTEASDTLPAGMIATDGAASLTLPVGNYLLTETHAPDGYNTLEYPVRVEVTSNDVIYKAYFGGQGDNYRWSHIKDGKGKTVQDVDATHTTKDINLLIPNSPGVKLPSTGGAGTIPYTILGSALVLLAIALFLKKSRQY